MSSPSLPASADPVFLLIPAGGQGLRMGAGVPKQFRDWGGMPLLQATILAFLAPGMPPLAGIALAVPEDRLEQVRAWTFPVPLVAVAGGTTRQASVARALGALSAWSVSSASSVSTASSASSASSASGVSTASSALGVSSASGAPSAPSAPGSQSNLAGARVMIHDAVRPFPPAAPVREALEALEGPDGWDGALLGEPSTDTLKRVAGDGQVLGTEPRESLFRAQTPQVARLALWREAFQWAEAEGFQGTDDVSLLEAMGRRVKLIPSPSSNLKLTTPEDWARACPGISG